MSHQNSLRIGGLGALTVAILMLGLSCAIFDTSPGGDALEPIEGRVAFWVGESHSHPGEEPMPTLFMSTEHVYPCCNYSIACRVSRIGPLLDVEILGALRPEIGLCAIGPAFSMLPVDLTRAVEWIRFTLNGEREEFSVTLTDSSISVAGGQNRFMQLTRSLVWRYPPLSCSYECGTTGETSWICADFLDSLMASGLYRPFQFPDSGQIPYWGTTAGNSYVMPTCYFRYAREEDFDLAGAMLERYARRAINGHPGVRLSLLSWRNVQYTFLLLDD
ncbi:hypothetical protein JXA88_13835 [Candidatus Fermentibacteria bacterium]|nr:hypothetical protein [Candidatus Fermentibacteria bacterium]